MQKAERRESELEVEERTNVFDSRYQSIRTTKEWFSAVYAAIGIVPTSGARRSATANGSNGKVRADIILDAASGRGCMVQKQDPADGAQLVIINEIETVAVVPAAVTTDTLVTEVDMIDVDLIELESAVSTGLVDSMEQHDTGGPPGPW